MRHPLLKGNMTNKHSSSLDRTVTHKKCARKNIFNLHARNCTKDAIKHTHTHTFMRMLYVHAHTNRRREVAFHSSTRLPEGLSLQRPLHLTLMSRVRREKKQTERKQEEK